MTQLPVCDHYAGNIKFARKALALQTEKHLSGLVVQQNFDITLDLEDGAAIGQEATLAAEFAALINSADNVAKRLGIRFHAVDHPHFAADVGIVLQQNAAQPAYIMLPKIDTLEQLQYAIQAIDLNAKEADIPLHALIESPLGVANVNAIAAHPRIESLSFGVMDFVSAHHGALPAAAMKSPMQFQHPLIIHAKTAISAACHAHGKTPSHNVCTDFANLESIRNDAWRAKTEFSFTRMWSIHPAQIEPILTTFLPSSTELADAAAIITAARAAHWGPISYKGILHDRASYRYYANLLGMSLF